MANSEEDDISDNIFMTTSPMRKHAGVANKDLLKNFQEQLLQC